MKKRPPNRIFIGTSGFSYKEWKGIFYPEDLPAKQYLSFYAKHFPTTEINNTFYRMPSMRVTEQWYDEVPADFSFTLKLTQKVTHMKRLKNVDEEMRIFLEGAAGLREKLATILVQLPPYAKKDSEALETFLARFASRARLACEFRHDSWFDDETYAILRKHNAALAVVHGEERKTVQEITADFVYMRLRNEEYSRTDLERWADWIHSQPLNVYCYLKHDEQAPVLAQQLKEILKV
jgi:uncharacterized protein YecE (DUF72 family)